MYVIDQWIESFYHLKKTALDYWLRTPHCIRARIEFKLSAFVSDGNALALAA
jgi:hypothetical protein